MTINWILLILCILQPLHGAVPVVTYSDGSTTSTTSPENVLDGNPNTYWKPTGKNKNYRYSIEFRFGQTTTVQGLKVGAMADNSHDPVRIEVFQKNGNSWDKSYTLNGEKKKLLQEWTFSKDIVAQEFGLRFTTQSGWAPYISTVEFLQPSFECPAQQRSVSGTGGVVKVKVSDSYDDAEECVNSGDVSRTSSDLELTNDGCDQIVGIRFQDIRIPQSQKISHSYIEFEVDETGSGSIDLDIQVQATSSPCTLR
eukprot:NODE_4289_length_811_cov_23.517544_g4131_i0.p1 GENE.NODE_4289_length_811_cov_23.517544_g4131_i0~~NODE_4289_length_811_cov_23.517544_g4131_i0.p1  ORF type:complete len:269 (+),score=48.31 NODE_4289_length_811_cov_23.517544_g4131_i0:48-809(+)